jgi:DNA-binding MarR family transcriptional regulator
MLAPFAVALSYSTAYNFRNRMPRRTKRPPMPRRARAFELERFVPYLVTQIYHRLNKSFARALRPLHLIPAQWRVLANLASRDGRTFTELLQFTALDQPTLSRTVARLVRGGYVTRKKKVGDGRAVELWLTPAGRRMWARALPVGEEQYRLAIRGVPAADRQRLAAILARMLDNVRAMPGGGRAKGGGRRA